jgi:hypothetical protein
MQPSERIIELAEKNWKNGIDPHFSGSPSAGDYIGAILTYLDEKEDK